MDPAEQFQNLSQLAEIRRDADTAAMDRLRARLRGLELQMAQLEQAAVDAAIGSEDHPTAFQMSGRDGIWDAWRRMRLRELGLQAAGLRADIEAQGLVVRRAIGRHQVMCELTDRLRLAARRKGDPI